MSKSESVEEFLARGGKIMRVKTGVRAIDASRAGNAFRDAARNGGTVLSDVTISETFSDGCREIAHENFHSKDKNK